MLPPIDRYKTHSSRVIEEFKKVVCGIRTARPNAALVENIKVTYYNQILPLKHVASIGVAPPRSIVIQVWDKEAVVEVLKAIEGSTLNLGTSVDGNVIRLNLPELSKERREELVRQVKKLAEDHRIQIRHLRDEIMRDIQKSLDSHEVTEDQKFRLKEEVQKEVDKTNEEIEQIVRRKVKEISE